MGAGEAEDGGFGGRREVSEKWRLGRMSRARREGDGGCWYAWNQGARKTESNRYGLSIW